MRHSFKGASALAALCAGALAFGSVVPAQANVPGASGNPADIARVAGIDRTQTALEATTAAAPGTIDKFFIVGYNNQVDALTLAPWNCVLADSRSNNGYVIYARGGALEARNLEVLKANPQAAVYIIGGTKAVAAGVEKQIRDLNAKSTSPRPVITRVGGPDRYDTAYQVGGFVLEQCQGDFGIETAKTNIDKANAAIAAYQDALARYNKAVAAEAAAQKALAAAKAKADAAWKVLEATAAKKADIAAAKKALDDAEAAMATYKEGLQKKIDLLRVVVDGIAVFDYQIPGIDENAITIQDYIDNADTDREKQVAAVLKHLVDNSSDFGGILATDTLNLALAKVKPVLSQLQKDINNNAAVWGAYASALKKYQDLLQHNSGLISPGSSAYDAWKAASDQVVAATNKLLAAQAELDNAINLLSSLTQSYLKALKDLPGLHALYRAALDRAYQNTTRVIFVSTGVNFADALAAGPAAAKQGGLVLLTKGENVPAITKRALDLSKSQTVGIGGPAVRAMKKIHSQSAVTLVGKDRYETAVKVAKRYFADATVKGAADGLYVLASGEVAADAVVAGAYLTSQANYGGILLTKKNSLPKVTANFLSFGTTGANQTKPYIGAVAVFGGTGAIAKGVFADAKDAAHMQ